MARPTEFQDAVMNAAAVSECQVLARLLSLDADDLNPTKEDEDE